MTESEEGDKATFHFMIIFKLCVQANLYTGERETGRRGRVRQCEMFKMHAYMTSTHDENHDFYKPNQTNRKQYTHKHKKRKNTLTNVFVMNSRKKYWQDKSQKNLSVCARGEGNINEKRLNQWKNIIEKRVPIFPILRV